MFSSARIRARQPWRSPIRRRPGDRAVAAGWELTSRRAMPSASTASGAGGGEVQCAAPAESAAADQVHGTCEQRVAGPVFEPHHPGDQRGRGGSGAPRPARRTQFPTSARYDRQAQRTLPRRGAWPADLVRVRWRERPAGPPRCGVARRVALLVHPVQFAGPAEPFGLPGAGAFADVPQQIGGGAAEEVEAGVPRVRGGAGRSSRQLTAVARAASSCGRSARRVRSPGDRRSARHGGSGRRPAH